MPEVRMCREDHGLEESRSKAHLLGCRERGKLKLRREHEL